MENKFNIETDIYLESFQKHKGKALPTLLGFYKKSYFKFALSTLFYIIKHSPVWVLPIITANIINYVTEKDPNVYSLIGFNAGLLAFLVILNIPMNYLHMHFRSSVVRTVEAGLRSTLVHKIQVMSILKHKDIESGRLQSKIIRDVEAVETLSDQLFTSLLNIVINIVVALSVTIFKSKIVFVFFLLMVPLAAFLVFTFKKPIKEYNKKFRREMENTSARVMEMVELVPVTRAHALEDEEINKMDKQVQMIAEAGYRLDIIQANFGAVSWACFQLFQIVCLVFTAFLAINGKIQVGDVVLYQSYFTTVVSQVSSLLTLLPTISKGLESVNSIGEILMIEDDEDDTGKPSIEEVKGVFDFENVSFAYPGSQENVIENMNMHVNQGETVAFVGESGAGKTTIINMLIGFMTPSNGRVLLDGQDMSQINLHSYRENLAVVPQNTILFSGTIRDNILYGTNDVTEEELNRVIDEAGLRSVIEKFPDGIETVVGEHGDKLSGGQKQRISIARALIRKPKVIILDEATSALDAISEREVTSAIDHMSHDRTTFIVAHKLATIEKADKIVVMQNGVIAEQGSFDELMKKKGYFYNLEQDYRG